jgi:hypothetical protein
VCLGAKGQSGMDYALMWSEESANQISSNHSECAPDGSCLGPRCSGEAERNF